MKKTKVIATIGPSSKDEDILRELILNGMDIARINMTHSSYKFCLDVIEKINKINKDLNTNTSIMLDLKGPDITVGKFTGGSAYLNKGDKIRIYADDIMGDSTKFSVSYKGLIKDVKTNTIIKLADGLIELNVLEKGLDYLLCEVMNGGFIEDNKGLNVIGLRLNIPFLSDKDREDIKFAHEHKIDFLALSFVNSVEDVLEVNDMLINMGNDNISIVSKIENESALEDLDNIIKNSDAIMVARGDLGVEIPFERVPGIQKTIINKCHREGKVSIVATEMMSSMENNVRPSRAEVNDVATAVLDGVDCVLLSGETTVGRYPVLTLSMMSKILEATELDLDYYDFLDRTMRSEKQNITGTIAYSVVESADKLKAKFIVAPTMRGYTAEKISRFRPICPIIALSPDINTVKRLNLYYGVYPILVNEIKTFDDIMKKARECAVKYKASEKDVIIITGGYPFNEKKDTNFMKIEEI